MNSDEETAPNVNAFGKPFPVDDFATVGAMMLTEAIEYEEAYSRDDFYSQMKAQFGTVIDSHWDEICVQSLKRRNQWLNEERKNLTGVFSNREYGWELSDEEVAEIFGEELENGREVQDTQRELDEAQQALMEAEEASRNAAQGLREATRKIALEFERLARGDEEKTKEP